MIGMSSLLPGRDEEDNVCILVGRKRSDLEMYKILRGLAAWVSRTCSHSQNKRSVINKKKSFSHQGY